MESWKSVARRSCSSIAFASFLISGSVLILFAVNYVVPSPYMDEIFHVDQMQRYCRGRFHEWNDKITTPPALYLATYGIWWVIDAIAGVFGDRWPIQFDCISTTHLRFVNLFFLGALYFVFLDILRVQSTTRSTSDGNRWSIVPQATAFNLCFFPVLYFTGFLYYTDVLSTLTVASTYLFQLRRHRWISAMFGAVSCAVRQTNIIWLVFCCYLSAIEAITYHLRRTDTKDRRRIDYENDPIALITRLLEFLRRSTWTDCWRLVWTCLRAISPYVLVGLGFLGFLIRNEGVALGDRSAHQACAHLVQFFYCLLFICVFGSTVMVSKSSIAFLVRSPIRRPLATVLATMVVLSIIHWFTYDHPYLLADNRHYTFYIWRRWFMRHETAKYVLAPAYVGAFLLVAVKSLSPSRSVLWRLGFLGCTFLATAPNRLLEFRYFILPFVFWRLHVPLQSKIRLGLEFLFFFGINFITFSLFLLKPFKWTNSDEWQRFMW